VDHVAISVVLFSFLTTFIGLLHASASLSLTAASFSNGPPLSSLLTAIRGEPLLSLPSGYKEGIPESDTT